MYFGGKSMAETKTMRLYGMIGQVKKNKTVTKCKPVFRDWSKNIYEAQVVDGIIIDFIPTDLSQYGNPVFLPASKKKIGDGKEYFFVFQHTKSKQNFYGDYWVYSESKDISVGVYDNSEFVVLAEPNLDEETMTRYYLRE